MPKTLKASLGFFRRTGVIYYHIGSLAFGVQRFLDALTSDKILLAPTSLPCPLEALLSRRIHHYQCITKTIPAGFQQKRGVEHRYLTSVGCHPGGLLFQKAPNFRMSQLFQKSSLAWPLRGGRENDLRQPFTVNLAFLVEYGVSPPRPGGLPDLRLSQNLVSRAIRVQQAGSALFQVPGNEAFPAGYPPENPNHVHEFRTRIPLAGKK